MGGTLYTIFAVASIAATAFGRPNADIHDEQKTEVGLRKATNPFSPVSGKPPSLDSELINLASKKTNQVLNLRILEIKEILGSTSNVESEVSGLHNVINSSTEAESMCQNSESGYIWQSVINYLNVGLNIIYTLGDVVSNSVNKGQQLADFGLLSSGAAPDAINKETDLAINVNTSGTRYLEEGFNQKVTNFTFMQQIKDNLGNEDQKIITGADHLSSSALSHGLNPKIVDSVETVPRKEDHILHYDNHHATPHPILAEKYFPTIDHLRYNKSNKENNVKTYG